MTEHELLQALKIGEEKDWELKSAKGGVPRSLWETYSAMANTDGGRIALGVEDDGSVTGLIDPQKVKKGVWDSLNDRGKVSINLLANQDVEVLEADGKPVLIIRVPRADRHQRPVYVGQNPLTGTYRRNFEGDYHCTPDEVGRMLADCSEEPADSRILAGFGLNDLDEPSLQQYRQLFSSRSPNHPWLVEDTRVFLEKLGGWRTDSQKNQTGLTVAGILMFGKDEVIRAPRALPQFHLDYREKLSADPNVRWSDRLTIDGRWVANLFQFYQRIIQRLTADLQIPFQLKPDLLRKDDTIVHEAVREALVNALIHADFQGQGGIVIEKYRDRIELSNPGTLLLSIDQILNGGLSECRNKSLQTMFLMIGGGEKAGSGIDKIWKGWRSQHWRLPSLQQTLQPDRVKLVLPMVSLLPRESLRRLRVRFGVGFRRLSELEAQALVTADIEGAVTNQRLREMSEEHPADLTRLLQGLVAQGFLQPEGQKRWTVYRLSANSTHKGSRSSIHRRAKSAHKASNALRKKSIRRVKTKPYRGPWIAGSPRKILRGNSTHKGDSTHKTMQGNSTHKGDSTHKADFSKRAWAKLKAIAALAFQNPRLSSEETREIILRLCTGQYLTGADLGLLMNRTANNLRYRFLTPLVQKGLLLRRYPREPNRPDQAYTAKNSKALIPNGEALQKSEGISESR